MEAYTLFPAKHSANEYFLCTSERTKHLAGQLQYKLEREKIASIEIDRETIDDTHGWSEIRNEDYATILPSLIPKTPTGGKPDQWIIITVWRKVIGEEIWIKAALHKTDTPDLIAVMTTTNDRQNIEKEGQRAIQSHMADWYVGHYRTTAPLAFWMSLIDA
jgi:hypothetical protein